MDKNEELKIIIDEVQRYAELKKAFLLNKILRDSPLMNEMERIQVTQQMEAIRKNLQLGLQSFQNILKDMENDKNFPTPRREKKFHHQQPPFPQPQAQVQKVQSFQEQQELEQDDFILEDPELWNELRKRYCVNRKCKYSFMMGKNFKRTIKKCVRCGCQTISLISNNS